MCDCIVSCQNDVCKAWAHVVHLRIGNAAIKEDIIDQYETAGPHKLEHRFIVVPILSFVCVCAPHHAPLSTPSRDLKNHSTPRCGIQPAVLMMQTSHVRCRTDERKIKGIRLLRQHGPEHIFRYANPSIDLHGHQLTWFLTTCWLIIFVYNEMIIISSQQHAASNFIPCG